MPTKLVKSKLRDVRDGDGFWHKGFAVESLAHNHFSLLIPHCFGKDKHGFLPLCRTYLDRSYLSTDIPYMLTKHMIQKLLSVKYV